MYRAYNFIGDQERAGSAVQTAVVPEALIYVGTLSLTMAVLVVLCHLYRTFTRRDGRAVFVADDKLILVYFYAVVIVFVAVAAL